MQAEQLLHMEPEVLSSGASSSASRAACLRSEEDNDFFEQVAYCGSYPTP